MNTARRQSRRGFALIIVMIVIVVLGVLAGGFAYSMKVETKLARNTSFEPDMQWLGRSGVELARYVLAQQLLIPTEPWDSLNQMWAGGPMGTNEALAEVSLENNLLGMGSFSVKIVDLERKFNINQVNEEVLLRALELVGADPSDGEVIRDSLLDWRDTDDDRQVKGAERADYNSSPNPGYSAYNAKNGPIDSIAELLLIQGITPALYWGPRRFDPMLKLQPSPEQMPFPGAELGASFDGGLVDLFTAISSGRINVNTASAAVLQLIPGLDEGMAQGIIQTRAGPDGVDGTEDDTPFATPRELVNVPGISPPIATHLQRFCVTRSMTFEVMVEARVDEYRRRFVAVVRRVSPRDVQILTFFWW